MPLYDYICAEGHIFEKFAGYDDAELECPKCGHLAVRIPINQNQSIITETGAKNSRRAEVPFRERYLKPEYDRFCEASQEIDYAYTKLEDSMGIDRSRNEYITPSLYKTGLARARKLEKAGVKPSEFRKTVKS